MDDESAIPLTQLGNETNPKQCLEMPMCVDKKEAEGESEDRTPKRNCLIRCGNFVRAKSKLFWLLFFIKTICFVVELGIYSKQSDFILSTNYSAAMTKFNGSLELFDEEKEDHLIKHQINMCGLIILDLVILAFIFVEAGPYLWSLIGRLLECIIGICRRVLWCVRRENCSVTSEKHEEIKQAMFAIFFVVFMPNAIISVISLDSSSLLSTFYSTAAWIVVVGTCLLVMKLPTRFNIVLLWMISVAHLYILTDVYFYLTEVRKSFPDDHLKDELSNFSIQVGFDPESVYITKNTDNDNLTDAAYCAGIFFNKRIMFRDTPIGYSYDELEKDDPALNLLDVLEKLYEENATTLDIKIQMAMKRRKSLRSKRNRLILSIFAHEIGHWKYNHVPWKFAVLTVDRLLQVLLFVALCKHKPLYTAFGFKSQPLLIGAIIIIYMVAGPYDFFKTFVINWISQTFERQADHYTTTVGLGSEFCSLFSRISNLTPFQEDWLFSLYRHDHPPLYERVRALNCTGT